MSFAEQLARLQVFLDADDLHEEALDYIAAHGYLTALCICSEQVPEREWIDALFSEPPKYKDDTEREAIEATLVQLKAHIARQLASDEDMELPCELDLGEDPDESDLRGWCIGFMEGVFLREAVWFEDSEDARDVSYEYDCGSGYLHVFLDGIKLQKMDDGKRAEAAERQS